jgi:hypothetical protein
VMIAVKVIILSLVVGTPVKLIVKLADGAE